MSRGPITRVAKTRKVDRRNSVLQAAWVHHLDAPPTSSPRDDLIIENGQPLPPAASADVVLLMANPGATAGFDHAAALGRAGARILLKLGADVNATTRPGIEGGMNFFDFARETSREMCALALSCLTERRAVPPTVAELLRIHFL